MRSIILLLIFLLVCSLSAEICWGEGSPLFEGNFIYRTHSVKTAADEIFTCWVEMEDSMRKLMLQKTDHQGNLLWAEPVTIAENSEFMLEKAIMNSTDNNLFVEVCSDNSNENQLYKLDDDASILWSIDYTQDYHDNFLPLDNGGAINVRISILDNYYHLIGRYIDNEGNLIWDDLDLCVLPDQITNNRIVYKEFIDDQLYVIVHIAGYEYFMKFSEEGEPLLISSGYEAPDQSMVKFMNEHFYIIFMDNEDDSLKMWQFDLEGNSISGTDPVIITTPIGTIYNTVLAGDGYFYCLSYDNDTIYLLKSDFMGNLQDEYFVHVNDLPYLEAYDQETDFINVSYYDDDGYVNYLITIDDEGPSSPIYYLPQEPIRHIFYDKYYINDGFIMTGVVNREYDFIATLRKTDDQSSLTEIRKIENDIIVPELVITDDGLHTYWKSYSKSAIMTQNFDHNGIPQQEQNGEILINDVSSFYYWENNYYCFDIIYSEDTADTVVISAYDFEGNQLWTEPQMFRVNNDYHNHIGITPFYDGLLFHIATDTGEWVYSEMEAMYFDETGFIWSEPVTMDFGYVETYRAYEFKSNILFHDFNGNVSAVVLNEDGSCEDQYTVALSTDLKGVYGTDDHFFVRTRSDNDENYALHYFRDGNSFWDEPFYYDIHIYYNLEPFFAENFFYLTGNNNEDIMEVNQYDYAQNLIPENSFSFNISNENVYGIDTYLVEDSFVFFIESSDSDYNEEVSYTIYNRDGTQLLAEFDETIIDIPDITGVDDIVFEDNCFYLNISTGKKVVEGEYEKNHYVQKVDISSIVANQNDMIPSKIYHLQNFPNPFNPSTTIEFELPASEHCTLKIFNLKGQLVKTLLSEDMERGNHQIIWNGKDDNGKQCASGIFFCRLLNGTKYKTNKLVLLK